MAGGFVGGFAGLERLLLGMNELGDEGAIELMVAAVGKHGRLRELVLRRNRLGPAAVEALSEFLR